MTKMKKFRSITPPEDPTPVINPTINWWEQD